MAKLQLGSSNKTSYHSPLNTNYISQLENGYTGHEIKKASHHNHGNCNNYNIRVILKESIKVKCIIYNQVPKCGSATFRDVLSKLKYNLSYTAISGDYTICRGHNHAFNCKRHDMKELTQHTKIRCLNHSDTGHIYFRHQYFANFNIIGFETPSFINLIRDPVEHYISTFYYRRFGKASSLLTPIFYRQTFYHSNETQRIMNMTFDQCVQSNDIECMNSTFTFTIIPFFCGYEEFCFEPTDRALAKAKQNVDNFFPVVGYIENFIQFLKLCEVIWPQFFKNAVEIFLTKVKNQNISKQRKRYEPSEKTKAIMASRLHLEYKFYNWIKYRFLCMYAFYVNKKEFGTHPVERYSQDIN